DMIYPVNHRDYCRGGFTQIFNTNRQSNKPAPTGYYGRSTGHDITGNRSQIISCHVRSND
ncbi:hypothetical protein QUA81_22240, partial [Microcoleus sp. F6_B4]